MDIRFSSEELAALLGGFDMAHFCCPMTMGGPKKGMPEAVKRGRKSVLARYRDAGLVDAEGRPINELAAALMPLRGPGIYVADNKGHELAKGRPDHRNAAVYVTDEAATYAERDRGPFAGWHLRRLEGEDETLRALLLLNGVGDQFVPAASSTHTVVPKDPTRPAADEMPWVAALAQGDWGVVQATAERVGFDPTELLRFGEAYQAGMARARSGEGDPPACPVFSTHDNSACELIVDNGINTGLEGSGLLRTKITQVFPAFGFSYSVVRSPYPNDPSDWWESEEGRVSRQFGCFDFYESAEDLARRLLVIDDNPDAPREA